MVKVIDSIMGSGKTQYVIKLMNEADEPKKFIYVTPFLDEVERVKNSVTKRKFHSPDVKYGEGSKYEHFKKLITTGENIVTTHALFSRADNDLIERLQYENYTLIIDEVMEVLNQINLKKSDILNLIESKLIQVNENKSITWIGDPKYDGRFNDVKDFAFSENLFIVRDMAIVWNFPAKIFDAFDEVYILTYMFNGQLQKSYYDFHGVQYVFYSIHNGELVPFTRKYENREQLKKLIDIYEGKLNLIGERPTNFSVSWFKKNKSSGKLKELKNNLYNYFRNVINAKSDEIMWSTWKDYRNRIRGRGYSKQFIPWNTRSTNSLINKNVLAFCINRYLSPVEDSFFKDHNIEINQDLLALSDLLQWVFRSAIREYKPT